MRLCLGATVLAMGMLATPVAAEVDLDLSYVDTNSPAWAAFATWVEQAIVGPPGYGFSATDAATYARVTGSSAACTLAAGLVRAEYQAAQVSIGQGVRPAIAGDSYLEVGPRVRDIALTVDWCPAALSAGERALWLDFAHQAVWNVWNHEDAEWNGQSFPWSGWSVNDPGNNYHFSFLTATAYWVFAADDTTEFRPFLANTKLPAVVAFFQNLSGGGSREGTAYGLAQANLFELLRLWRDETGEDLAAGLPHVADSIDYWIHATVPTFAYTAAIGDQARVSMPELYDYHRRIVLEARMLTADPGRRARASWWLGKIPIVAMSSTFNRRFDLFPAGAGGSPPSSRSYHATGVGHFFARSRFAEDALWLAIVAGPYDQSHAHRDQGSFSLFRGDWLAVTENVHTHSGIQQGSEVHNVVRFEGPGGVVPQRESVSSFAVVDNGERILADADLSPAFANEDDGVTSWTRSFDFDPFGGSLVVWDLATVDPGVTAHWQVNVPTEPTIEPDGSILAGALRIVPITPASPAISIHEWSTTDPTEFLDGWRVTLSGGTGEYLVELVDETTAARHIFVDGFEIGNTSRWSP